MKMISIALGLLLLSTPAFAQQTINQVKVNELTLPKETAEKVLYTDADKKVKSSTVDVTALENLDGATGNIQDQIDAIDGRVTVEETTSADHETRLDVVESVNDFQSSEISNIQDDVTAIQDDFVSRTLTQNIEGTKSFSGKLITVSTTNGSRPCPVMTDAQMLAVSSPSNGDCVYNSTKKAPFYYNSTDAKWKLAGGGAGGSRLSLLIDGSFEDDAGFADGGVCTNCTATSETTQVMATVNNEKSLKLAFSAAGNFTITKTHSNAFVNAQGYVVVWVYTTASDVTLSSMVNGSLVINRPVNVLGSWYRYEILTTMGNTSFGYRITKGSAGDVYIDESTAGPGESAISSTGVTTLAGESYFAGTNGCVPSRNLATVGSLTADTDCPGPTVTSQNLGQWATTDSDLMRQTVNSLPKGTYRARFITRFNSNSGVTFAGTITDGTTSCEPTVLGSLNTFNSPATIECVFTYTSAGNRNFELQIGSTGAVAVFLDNSITAPRGSTKFTLEKLDSISTLESTNSNTGWLPCGHTTSDFQGFGTVTNIETQCKREGDDLLMRGKFISGVATTTEARLALKLNGQSLTSSGTSKIPSLQMAGSGGINIAASSYFGTYTLMEPNVSYITWSRQDSTRNMLAKINGDQFTANGYNVTFDARIPISGWENSNTIIADVSGLEKCTDTWSCTDVASADISAAGAKSNDTLSVINTITKTAGSDQYVITFNTGKFTVPPKVDVTITATATGVVGYYLATKTATGVTVNFINSSGAVTNAGGVGFNIGFTKQGADLVGKTAKAVANDQNDRTPGVLNKVNYQAYLTTGTAGWLDQTGTWLSSCTAANPQVCTFSGSAFDSGSRVYCTAIAVTGSASGFIPQIQSLASSGITLVTKTDSGVNTASSYMLDCKGVKTP